MIDASLADFTQTEGSLRQRGGLTASEMPELRLDASSESSKDLAFKKGESSPSISDLRDFASLAGSSDISEIKKNTEEKRFKES